MCVNGDEPCTVGVGPLTLSHASKSPQSFLNMPKSGFHLRYFKSQLMGVVSVYLDIFKIQLKIQVEVVFTLTILVRQESKNAECRLRAQIPVSKTTSLSLMGCAL